jgi:hypothetical protein
MLREVWAKRYARQLFIVAVVRKDQAVRRNLFAIAGSVELGRIRQVVFPSIVFIGFRIAVRNGSITIEGRQCFDAD